MSQENATGIVYPEITLGGVKYVVKFSRGTCVYRLSKLGITPGNFVPGKSFATMIDVLHAAIMDQFPGSAEQLAELVIDEAKTIEASVAVRDALGKAFPPTQPAAPENDGTPAGPIQ